MFSELVILGLLALAIVLYIAARWRLRPHIVATEVASIPLRHPRQIIDVDRSPLTTLPLCHQEIPHLLVLDTETLHPVERTDAPAYPSPVVSLSWTLLDKHGRPVCEHCYILKRTAPVDPRATALHGITTETMMRTGHDPKTVYALLEQALAQVGTVAAHHLAFHLAVIRADMASLGMTAPTLETHETICTMEYGRTLGFKRHNGQSLYPSLPELFSWCYFRCQRELYYSNKGLRDIRLVAACLRALALAVVPTQSTSHSKQ